MSERFKADLKNWEITKVKAFALSKIPKVVEKISKVKVVENLAWLVKNVENADMVLRALSREIVIDVNIDMEEKSIYMVTLSVLPKEYKLFAIVKHKIPLREVA